MMADPHPDVTVILKRTDGIVHRTPHELTDKDIKMKKEKKCWENQEKKDFSFVVKIGIERIEALSARDYILQRYSI